MRLKGKGLDRNAITQKNKKKEQIIKLTHKQHVRLHKFKLKCAASATETKFAVKLLEKQENLAQSALQIKRTKHLPNGQFPNTGGMSTEQLTSVHEVSHVLLLFLFTILYSHIVLTGRLYYCRQQKQGLQQANCSQWVASTDVDTTHDASRKSYARDGSCLDANSRDTKSG